MTAPDTPSREELLALLNNGLRAADCLNRALIEHMARRFPNDVPSAAVEKAMSEWEAARAKLPSYDECQRLAAKPDDDGVREWAFTKGEQAVRIEAFKDGVLTSTVAELPIGQSFEQIAECICRSHNSYMPRALSTKAKP